MSNGEFSLLKNIPIEQNDKKLAKGDVAVVRLVKGVSGKGVTV